MACKDPNLAQIEWKNGFLLIHLSMLDRQGGSDFDSRAEIICNHASIWMFLEPTHYWYT